MTRRLIGVLGGMGPLATVDFMQKVILATPAERDQDHVPLLVHAVPQIPDRIQAIADGSDGPFHALLKGLRVLESSETELVVIPCNTAHVWFDRLAASTDLRLLHIAESVRASLEAGAGKSRTIALMATTATIRAGFYQRYLMTPDRTVTLPSTAIQGQLADSIAAIKAGNMARGKDLALEAATALVSEGADSLLLACTELPIVLQGTALEAYCIDATACLAEACVAFSLDDHPRARLTPG